MCCCLVRRRAINQFLFCPSLSSWCCVYPHYHWIWVLFDYDSLTLNKAVMLFFLHCYSSQQASFISFHLVTWHQLWSLGSFFKLHVLLEDQELFKTSKISNANQQDIEDLDHYEMKEEEPVDGKKSEDDGIEKENLAILEKIRKNQRQDHLNVSPWSVMFLLWRKVLRKTVKEQGSGEALCTFLCQ